MVVTFGMASFGMAVLGVCIGRCGMAMCLIVLVAVRGGSRIMEREGHKVT